MKTLGSSKSYRGSPVRGLYQKSSIESERLTDKFQGAFPGGGGGGRSSWPKIAIKHNISARRMERHLAVGKLKEGPFVPKQQVTTTYLTSHEPFPEEFFLDAALVTVYPLPYLTLPSEKRAPVAFGGPRNLV